MSPIASNDDWPLCGLNGFVEAHRQAEMLRQRIKDHDMSRAPIHIQTFPPRKITGAQLAVKAGKLFGGVFLAGLALRFGLFTYEWARLRGWL